MSKALWFVVRDVPHRSGDLPFGDSFPPLEEVRRRMEAELRQIAREPLKQGRTTHSGPQPWIASGEADSKKLQIVEVAWKSP